MAPVTGPVTEVAPGDITEEDAGPAEAPPTRSQPAGVTIEPIEPVVPPGSATDADEPERAAPTMEELEKAVAEEAAGGDPVLDPFRAAVLGETMSAGTSSKGPDAEEQARPERSKPRLVVYDLESAFDDGALGAKVADVLTGHAARSGLFETFAEVEQDEILAAHPFAARRDAAATTVARHAREYFDADIVVWGQVAGTRQLPVLGVQYTSLRSWTVDADLAVAAHTEVCGSLHEIPIAVDRILEKLVGRPLEPTAARVAARIGPNLIANGAFKKKGHGRSVPGWESPLPRPGHLQRLDPR